MILDQTKRPLIAVNGRQWIVVNRQQHEREEPGIRVCDPSHQFALG